MLGSGYYSRPFCGRESKIQTDRHNQLEEGEREGVEFQNISDWTGCCGVGGGSGGGPRWAGPGRAEPGAGGLKWDQHGLTWE